jgi:hypothetical protein
MEGTCRHDQRGKGQTAETDSAYVHLDTLRGTHDRCARIAHDAALPGQ